RGPATHSTPYWKRHMLHSQVNTEQPTQATIDRRKPSMSSAHEARVGAPASQAHVDLRSDTVTHPTPAMREAMYRAEVGDDVYGEDPTVNRLQEMAAERLGKEAALFVPTGTMGNVAAMLTHAGRGRAVIVGNESHVYHYEVGGASTLGGS